MKKFLSIFLPVIVVSIILVTITATASTPSLFVTRGGTGLDSIPEGYSIWGNDINSMSATSSMSMDMKTGAVLIGQVEIGAVSGSSLEVRGNIIQNTRANYWIGSTGEGILWDGSGNYTAVIRSKVGQSILLDSDNNSDSHLFFIGHDSADPDTASYLFVVSENGRVGIGMTTPASSLDVNGGIRAGQLTADPCGGATYPEGTIFYNTTSDYYCFCDGSGVDKKISDNGACF